MNCLSSGTPGRQSWHVQIQLEEEEGEEEEGKEEEEGEEEEEEEVVWGGQP